MFPKVAIALSALAVAVPTPDADVCNTGNVQCCNSLYKTSDPGVAALLGLLGVAVQSVTAQVGLVCTPVTIGVSGIQCSQKPVCCKDNKFDGLVNIDCTTLSA